MKYSEGRTTFFGYESAAGKRRRARKAQAAAAEQDNLAINAKEGKAESEGESATEGVQKETEGVTELPR